MYAVCVCLCVRVRASLFDYSGMRQPSQLEGYLGTCVLRESPRANALGMLQHGRTHKYSHTHTLEDFALALINCVETV